MNYWSDNGNTVTINAPDYQSANLRNALFLASQGNPASIALLQSGAIGGGDGSRMAASRFSQSTGALTDDRMANSVLAGVPQAQDIAMSAARGANARFSDELPGWGRVGNEFHVGNQSFVQDDPMVAEEQLKALRKKVAMDRIAESNGMTKFDAFTQDPRIRQLSAPQQQAMYQLGFGHSVEDEAKAQESAMKALKERYEIQQMPVKADFDALQGIERAMGFNPIEGLNYYNPGTGMAELPGRKVRNPNAISPDAPDAYVDMPPRQIPITPEQFDTIATIAERRGLFNRKQAEQRMLLKAQEAQNIANRPAIQDRLAEQAKQFAEERSRSFFGGQKTQSTQSNKPRFVRQNGHTYELQPDGSYR